MTKAIILAAGRGSRMKELTSNKPKCLTEVFGKSLLEHQIHSLNKAGITEVGIVTGYMRESLLVYGLHEFYNPMWASTNMVTSLSKARDWLLDDECVVSYSDIFYDSSAVSSLLACNDEIALTYDVNWYSLWCSRFDEPLSDAESFKINNDGYVVEIGRHVDNISEIHGQYMGLLKFKPNGWLVLENYRKNIDIHRQDKMHMTGTLDDLISKSLIKVKGIPYSGIWGEVDSPSDLACYK